MRRWRGSAAARGSACRACVGAPDLIVGAVTDCLNTGWDGGDPHSQIEVLEARVAKLEAALEQSVELQSHYAELLNMYDGGQRLTFANVEAWLDRLDVLKAAPQLRPRCPIGRNKVVF